MKLLYTNPNRLIVENIKNVIENAGIKVKLQNEFAGGGIGELAPIDAWPELWLVNESDFDRANKLLDQINNETKNEWTCKHCGEDNGGNFEVCWKCQLPRSR